MKYVLMTLLVPIISYANPQVEQPEAIMTEEVKEEIDNERTPAWVQSETALAQEGDNLIVVHALEMSPNTRPEACLKSVALDSRLYVLNFVKEALQMTLAAETAVTRDPAYVTLNSYLTEDSTKGWQVEQTYLSKQEVATEDDSATNRLTCFVKSSVDARKLQQQIESSLASGGQKAVRQRLKAEIGAIFATFKAAVPPTP
jgi:preprotein translocase subunit SecD